MTAPASRPRLPVPLIAAAIHLAALLFVPPALAQSILDDRFEGSKQFLLQMTGSVGKERFANVTAILALGPAPPEAPNAYVITVSGWPRDNGTNTFIWVSDDTPMTSVSSRVVCRIVDSALKSPVPHFYYLSPKLLRMAVVTQHEKEDIARARKVALPIRIPANSGEMTLNFMGDTVSGQVWLNGYDPFGHQFVRYQASFTGEINNGLQSTHRIWKYD